MAFVLARLRALDTAGALALGRTSSLFRAAWSRCPCRSLRTNSWPRRCSSRSSSLRSSAGLRWTRGRLRGIREDSIGRCARGSPRGIVHGTPVRGTSNVRPWNPVVTAIAGPPFGTVPERRANGRERACRGKTEGVRRREARLAAAPARAGLLDVPPPERGHERRVRAKEPMNRAKNPLRRRPN